MTLESPPPESGGRARRRAGGAGYPTRIGVRYQVLNELGSDGVGAVFRVLDRLTGRVATLKRLKVSAADGTSALDSGGRAVLAREFALLAALRHPNIIGVLDYGCDAAGEPYFTMDLEENAQTILEAGRGRPLAVQVELLVQALRALAYLDGHGIIHGDLKPENIVVVGDQVKLLDFSHSRHRNVSRPRHQVGMPLDGAPEGPQAAPHPERGDLYALGLIAYELLVGAAPFDQHDGMGLSRDLLRTRPPRPLDDLDARWRPMLERLLTENPAEGYTAADEVIRDLAQACGQPLAIETVATRESLLQAAPLVGRASELAVLDDALLALANGRGGTWLIGGESGVGKSRLLDEARIRALVRGMIVLRGPAIAEGCGPYHQWRDVISHLVLHARLSEAQQAVLKSVVPNLASLLGRDVTEPFAAEPEVAQSRLLLAVEELFRAAALPLVVILDDLHGAGSESLKMLSWLARVAETMPLLLLGSFRIDEAPQLAEIIGGVREMRLGRLAAAEVATLCESVIGPRAQPHAVIDLVVRESEGIPFFVVEILRALAEASGSLAHIESETLPERVTAGGLLRVIRRRLKQVPAPALAPLQAAAVIGRVVNFPLLRALHPDLSCDDWAVTCATVAVLEQRDLQWRFSHDKLREQLCEDLSPAQRRLLHRRVAEALEQQHADRAEQVNALAHHWREAGDGFREAYYAERAGFWALEHGACQEAVTHLARAIDLLQSSAVAAPPTPRAPRATLRARVLDPNSGIDPDSFFFRVATIEAALMEAQFRLGDLASATCHGARALTLVGQPLPTSRAGWALGTTGELARRALQAASASYVSDAAARRIAPPIALVEQRFVELFYYVLKPARVIWAVLRVINRCAPVGPSPRLAHGYVYLAQIGELLGLWRLGSRWRARAISIATQTADPRDLGFTWSRLAVSDIGMCRWNDAEAALDRALGLAENAGDVRLMEECRVQFGVFYFFTGQFSRTTTSMKAALSLCRRSGNRQALCWALLGLGDALLRLGRGEEAVAQYAEVIGQLDERTTIADLVWGFGMYALARLRTGDYAGAYEWAGRALAQLPATRPVAYWVQHGTAAVCEVFLALREMGWTPAGYSPAPLTRQTQQAVSCMHQYARRFPLGRAQALLWDGLHAWLGGRRSRGLHLWRAAISAAKAAALPYESARAHYELGRHLPAHDPARVQHLEEARGMFTGLGCGAELERAERELARRSGMPVAA